MNRIKTVIARIFNLYTEAEMQEEIAMRNKYFRKYAALNAQLNKPVKTDMFLCSEDWVSLFTTTDNIKSVI